MSYSDSWIVLVSDDENSWTDMLGPYDEGTAKAAADEVKNVVRRRVDPTSPGSVDVTTIQITNPVRLHGYLGKLALRLAYRCPVCAHSTAPLGPGSNGTHSEDDGSCYACGTQCGDEDQ